MQIEWAVDCTSAKSTLVGYDLGGVGAGGNYVDRKSLPVEVGIPIMLCWLLDPDDDVGTEVTFCYEVIGPEGLAGREWIEAVAPPFFGTKDVSIGRFYLPLEVAFTVNQEGEYMVNFGDTSDPQIIGDIVELTARYSLPLRIEYQPDE